jgi:hypothetical protein
MNSYELSRAYFDWCFENPEKVNPNHTAIYFFAIEHCNRLGWREKFGFPTQMAMDAIGIKKHQTYIKYFNELCEWGFFKMVQKSSNQYSANIISLQFAKPKNGKALDKAIINHGAKQTEKQLSSIGQSNSSIDKPYNQEQINQLTNKQYTSEKIYVDENHLLSHINSVFGKQYKSIGRLNREKFEDMINKRGYTYQDILNAITNLKLNTFFKEKDYAPLSPSKLADIDFLEKYFHTISNVIKIERISV